MYERRFGDRGGGGRGGGGGFQRGGGRFEDRGGDRFGSADKPVKIGEEYTVKVTDVGAKGDGIAKINNFIIFVPGAKKGEEVKVKIKEISSRFAIGEKVGAGASEDEGEEKSEEDTKEDADEEETEESEEE